MQQTELAGERVRLRAFTGALFSCLALLASPLGTATAQNTRRPQAHADSARVVADLFFRAVADERWPAAASFMDTMAVRAMVAERWRWRSEDRAPDSLSVEFFMRDDPSKPRVVAEYELKRYREQMSKMNTDPLRHEFAGVRSLTELRALSATDATARFLQAQDERIQLRESLRAAGCPDSLAGAAVFRVRHIVAAALSDDTTAYVLHYEGRLEQPTNSSFVFDPMVMHLRLRREAWRIIPSYGLLRRMNSAISISGVECGMNAPSRPPG